MGSSSRNRGQGQGITGMGAKPVPTTETFMSPDISGKLVSRRAFTSPSQVPAGGGLVRPPAVPGLPRGAGMNFVMPTPAPVNPNRNLLANVLTNRPVRWAEGGGAMGGGWGSGNRGGYTSSAGGAGRSAGLF
jgi:hypothetical protein